MDGGRLGGGARAGGGKNLVADRASGNTAAASRDEVDQPTETTSRLATVPPNTDPHTFPVYSRA